MSVDIRQGECREVLETLPAASVHCVITSPSGQRLSAASATTGAAR